MSLRYSRRKKSVSDIFHAAKDNAKRSRETCQKELWRFIAAGIGAPAAGRSIIPSSFACRAASLQARLERDKVVSAHYRRPAFPKATPPAWIIHVPFYRSLYRSARVHRARAFGKRASLPIIFFVSSHWKVRQSSAGKVATRHNLHAFSAAIHLTAKRSTLISYAIRGGPSKRADYVAQPSNKTRHQRPYSPIGKYASYPAIPRKTNFRFALRYRVSFAPSKP